MGPIHDRMPVILGDNYRETWLDPSLGLRMLWPSSGPIPALDIYPVSTLVNSPDNNTPDCIRPGK